jgi:hypothetical protein
MFLFPDFLCFDSRLIAHETTITIPYRLLAEVPRLMRAPCAVTWRWRGCDAAQVTKQKILGIPNALEISISGQTEGSGVGLKL